jgi:predicted permease
MAVVALVLLIACANIANLLLARSAARARELAVRQALGAGCMRIVRQLLTESLLLALVGGVLGVVLALLGNRLLLRMVSIGVNPSGEMVPLDISLDLRLMAFTFAVTVFTAVLFGTVPAMLATRADLTHSLKDGRGASNIVTRNPLAKTLVISQVALSLVLLIGAGLFLHSLMNLNNVNTGFNKSNVLLLQIDSNTMGYAHDDPRLPVLFQQIEERVRALHGVEAASFASFTFRQGSWNGSVTVPAMPEHHEVNVKHNIVGNDYFNVTRIPLIAGRTFGRQDTKTSQKVVVISEHAAQTFFGGKDVLGHTYALGSPEDPYTAQVIGIVKDVKFASLNEETDTLDYMPYSQREWGMATLRCGTEETSTWSRRMFRTRSTV